MSNIQKAIFNIGTLRTILDKLEEEGYSEDTRVMVQLDNDSKATEDEEHPDSHSLAEVVGHEFEWVNRTDIDSKEEYPYQKALILHAEF